MTEAPNIGDLVVLNSGGPPMSVIETGYHVDFQGQGVRAMWLDASGTPQRAWFPRPCVTPYAGRPARRLRRPITSHWPVVGEA
jgi:uncharacterized protein YodC (DUF2158 family)